MHGFDYKDEDGINWYVNHNGDFSGEVLFGAPGTPFQETAIPFELLEEIVGRKLLNDAVSRLEDLSGAELLRSLT